MKNRKPKTGNKKPVNSAGFTSPVFGFLFSIHPLRGLLVALALLVLALPAGAKPLESQVKGLLGGLATSISPVGVGDPRNVLPKDLQELNASLATFRSLAPVPSASGAFKFEWDEEVGTFNRLRKGPGLADTAQTLGARFGTLSVSYSHLDFDQLDGSDLNSLDSDQPAFSEDFLDELPCDDPTDPAQCDRLRFQDDQLMTHVNFKMSNDTVFIGGAYGVTDSIDIGIALSLNHVKIKARARSILTDPNNDGPPSFEADFAEAYPCRDQPDNRLCVEDSFNDSATGTGDIYLRAKWRFIETEYADFAASGTLTIPTGNADDLLGFHDPTFTPLLIASKTYGRFSPHLNLGYAFRDGKDISQALWIAGSDFTVIDRLIVAADFLGFHDDKRDNINDDVFQSAIGLKLNLFGSAVISANFQFPLNDDGLRAKVIYTTQVEYTF